MNSEQYHEEFRELNGVTICITTYKIGDEFYCHVTNTDPGATIARASAALKEEAVRHALEKVMNRLAGKKG